MGAYFATDAGYSARHYSRPDADGLRYIYLTQILSGDYVVGTRDMKQPPPRVPDQPELFDSVVNDLNNPDEWVIFRDCHMYPEYIITFK